MQYLVKFLQYLVKFLQYLVKFLHEASEVDAVSCEVLAVFRNIFAEFLKLTTYCMISSVSIASWSWSCCWRRSLLSADVWKNVSGLTWAAVALNHDHHPDVLLLSYQSSPPVCTSGMVLVSSFTSYRTQQD
jgi:hypothetical protein